MAYGDTQYQVNDLINRVKALEAQAKGPLKKAAPYGTQTVTTSTGAGVAGGFLGQDAFSRAIVSTIQAGFTSVESLEYALLLPLAISFGGGTFAVMRTDFLRPDPVAGSVYRVTCAGQFHTGAAAHTLGIGINFSGAANPILISQVMGGNSTVFFWFEALFVVSVAGASGTVILSGFASAGGSNNTVLPAAVMNVSLIASSINVYITSDSADTTSTVTLNAYLIESLGFRQA